MKPRVTKKAAQAAPVVFCCFLIITLLVAIKVFSPPGPGTVTLTVPGSSDFSSPSSEARLRVLGSGFYTVTAYCPCEKCCGKWADGITASGHKIQAKDLIVAAPPGMPFGTVLEIPGYGRCRVQDRGGAIKGNRLDVLFATHQEALNWGVQELMVREVE